MSVEVDSSEIRQKRKVYNKLSTLNLGELSIVILQHTQQQETASSPVSKAKLLEYIENCIIESRQFAHSPDAVCKDLIEESSKLTTDRFADLDHDLSNLYQTVAADEQPEPETLDKLLAELQSISQHIDDYHTRLD